MFGIADNTEFLKAIGIDDAPEDVKQTLVAGLEELAQQKLVTRLADRLTDQQAEELDQLTDDQQVADWIKVNVPDFNVMVAEVMNEMRTDILKRKMEVTG